MSDLKIPENAKAILDEIEEKKLLKRDGGVYNLEDQDGLYERHLPEGITLDVAKQVHQHDSDFFLGVNAATGEQALRDMKDDEDLEVLQLKYNILKDEASVVVRRTGEQATNKPGEPRTTKKVYGVFDQRYTKHGAHKSKGKPKALSRAIGDKANDLFGE